STGSDCGAWVAPAATAGGAAANPTTSTAAETNDPVRRSITPLPSTIRASDADATDKYFICEDYSRLIHSTAVTGLHKVIPPVPGRVRSSPRPRQRRLDHVPDVRAGKYWA